MSWPRPGGVPVTLDVGGKLAVAGDTTLHGTDANVIRMGDARAVGDGRASAPA